MLTGPARARPRHALPLLIASLLVAALGAALIAALLIATRQGVLEGPALTLRLGSYAFVARATEHPDCLPLPEQCFIARPTFRVPQPRYYAVWVGQISYPLRQGRQSPFATVRGWQILRFALLPPG